MKDRINDLNRLVVPETTRYWRAVSLCPLRKFGAYIFVLFFAIFSIKYQSIQYRLKLIEMNYYIYKYIERSLWQY